MISARMYKNTLMLKKKILAQNSVFNVDYENKRDFVFTQNFFFET